MAQLTIQQTFDLALQHHQSGRLPEAEQIYRQILAQQPEHFSAMYQLGMISFWMGNTDVAVDLIRRAISLNPNWPDAHGNLGNILKRKGQLDEAIAAYRRAILLNPHQSGAYTNLGIALKDKGLLDEAIAAHHQAIALNPNLPQAHCNLGNALKEKGQFDQAIAAHRQAIVLNPNYADAYYNLGIALKEMGRLDEAIAAYRQTITLNPNWTDAHNNLGNVLKDKGQLDNAIAVYQQAIAINSKSSKAHSNLVYTLHFHPAYDAQAIAEEHQRWNQLHAEPLRKFIRAHSNDPSPDRRLRIGYVSPDFRMHPVGRSILPVLQQHDRNSLEVVCYSSTTRPDLLTPRFKTRAALWRDVWQLSDEQLAAQIRADRIDILVDLTLHMAGNRLLVFARKPAPVQVTWLGYPGTTGLETIDYRLTDPYMDPPGETDHFYCEKSIRLPETFQCYDPLTDEIPVNALPASQAGHVTFGCLNNLAKLNEPLFDAWANILRLAPNTRLLLKTGEESSARWIRDVFARHGISPQRLEFVGTQSSHEAYLRLYQRIDLVLDPFPYNGHTTSMDAIWMGVPVLSWCGKTAVSRAGLSQSSNLGMPELTAMSQADYIRMAVDLAGDLPRLAALRRTLRSRMQASPLMDASRFARGIEAAYRIMWRAWCEKISPQT